MQRAKMNKRVGQFFYFLLLAVLCQACAKSTLISSWVDDSFQGPIKGTVLVIGVFKNSSARKIYEDSFVEYLGKEGIKAVPSYQYGLGTTLPSRERLQQVVKKSGASTILITHLLSEATSTEEFPPEQECYVTVFSSDDIFDYHTFVYDQVWGEDVVERKVDRMEASLFDGKSGKRIWSARSKSVNLEDLVRKDDEQLESLFIKDMVQHNIL